MQYFSVTLMGTLFFNAFSHVHDNVFPHFYGEASHGFFGFGAKGR